MNLSLSNKYAAPLTVLFCVTAAYGILAFSPVMEKNLLFLFALPLVGLLMVLLIYSPRLFLVALILTRGLLDPLLDMTRLDFAGGNMGAGALLNLLPIILAVFLIIRRPHVLTTQAVGKSWLIFLSVCLASVFISPVPGTGVRMFLNLLTYFCMFVIPYYFVEKEGDREYWLRILLISSFAVALFAFVDLFSGGSYYSDAGVRIKGTFSHPNILAFYLVLAIAITFYILKSDQAGLTTKKRFLLNIFMVTLLFLVVATMTRNAWIACFLMFAFYGVTAERKYLLFICFIPLLPLLSPQISDRVSEIIAGHSSFSSNRLDSMTWRVEMWKSALLSAKQNILLGHGLASFKEFSVRFFEAGRTGAAAHNVYLQLLFETGICGLAAFLAVFFTIGRTVIGKIKSDHVPSRRGQVILTGYLLGYLVVSFADNVLDYLAFNWYFWFFIGIMTAPIRTTHDENLDNHSII